MVSGNPVLGPNMRRKQDMNKKEKCVGREDSWKNRKWKREKQVDKNTNRYVDR